MHVNTLSWDRGHKMYHNCHRTQHKTHLNIRLLCERGQTISICADQTPPIPVWTHVLASMRGHKVCLNTWWPKHPLPDRTKNVSQYVSTKTPYHASKDTMYISTRVDQKHPMLESSQYVSQNVLTKSLTSLRRLKIIQKCVHETPSIPMKTQNAISTWIDQI